MKRAINFFHDDNKILSSYDETFFRKDSSQWTKINKGVFKGVGNPSTNIGEEGDYYIEYEMVGNYLMYSEDFANVGWNNINNILNKDSYILFPETMSTKVIPNMIEGEHSLSTMWSNPKVEEMPYWCFSLYILPDEFKYFQLILSNSGETFGLIANFSITLNSRKRYVIEKDLIPFGSEESRSSIEFDDDCIGITPNSDGSYRVYVSCKFNTATSLKGKLKLLRNINGDITDNFANANNTAGLFINAAQLNKGKIPITYVPSNGKSFLYRIFKKLWLKETVNDSLIWKQLEPYNSIWFGNDEPELNYGETGDLYFIEPIIQIGKKVRFGKNTLFKNWKTNQNLTGDNYYTEYDDPKVGDLVYTYEDKPIVVGEVVSYSKSVNYKPSTMVVKINDAQITLYKDYLNSKRFLRNDGIVYWNEEKDTYAYSSEGELRNLKFNNSLYNKDLFMDAITFSTNLFNQSYSSRRDSRLGQHQIGVNGGGNYNCWDFNNLRKYY